MTTTTFENVLFLAGTSGATTKRTPAARWSDIINVKDFGATGNGVTDDTTAIQAAVNWTVATTQRGTIYFPIGRYVVSSPIQLPTGAGASYRLAGEGSGSVILGTFNGFIFDGLSNPYTVNNGGIVIERLSITNGYTGQNFTAAASSSWSASGSPVTINVPSLPSGITTNCLVYIIDQQIAPMPVFVGVTTSVVAGTSITLGSTAVGSSGLSNLNLAFVQSYAAAGTWAGNATTITMPGSPPAGVPSNCLVYDYDRILFGDGTIPNMWTMALGVGNWSGSTVTFTAGVSQASHTSTDRLVFAPLAGCIRLSSAVGATVRDCVLSGFIGITTSQDNVNTAGQQQGAESYSILIENNTLSTSAHAAAIGSTGMYMTNNSLSLVNDLSGWWVGTRISGICSSIKGGRTEVCTYGIALQSDQNTGNLVAGGVNIDGISLESHTYAIVQIGGAHVTINAINILCQNANGQYGIYVGGGGLVISASSVQGNWAGYGVYIIDQGNSAGQITFISTTVSNFNPAASFTGVISAGVLTASSVTGTIAVGQVISDLSGNVPANTYIVSLGTGSGGAGTYNLSNPCTVSSEAMTSARPWRIPAKAWWGTCVQCNNPPLVYTFANLPSGVSSPAPVEGDAYNISDSPTAAVGNFAANVTAGGGSNHVQVRWNGAHWTINGG